MKLLCRYLLLIILMLTVAGCGIRPENKAGDSSSVLYSVTDATGTTLSFSEKPQRIISLNLSADEILLDVVEHKRLVALSIYADDPAISGAPEKAKDVPHRVNTLNIEKIIDLRPDLIIIPDYKMEPVTALRSTGAKVFVAHTPDDIQGIFNYIETISAAVGEKHAGLALRQEMEQKLQAIHNKVTTYIPPKKQLKVLCMSFTGPIGMQGTFSDLCYYAGVKNALEGIDIPYQANLSEEKLLEINPDMIITPSWDYSKQGDPEEFKQRILHNPLYQDIKAVKNNKVTRIHDQYMYSTSQYTVRAVEEIAAVAYPEVFEK